jgi:cation transport regulator ChaC
LPAVGAAEPAGPWVFAYGSNMHLGDLERWFARRSLPAPVLHEAVAAVLPGWQLVWNYHSRERRGGAANVEPAPGARLPGVALLPDAATFEGIAQKEGYPKIYERQLVPLDLTDGRRVEAFVYVVVPARRSPHPEPPAPEYLNLLITGAEAHGLDPAHVAMLRATPTR